MCLWIVNLILFIFYAFKIILSKRFIVLRLTKYYTVSHINLLINYNISSKNLFCIIFFLLILVRHLIIILQLLLFKKNDAS